VSHAEKRARRKNVRSPVFQAFQRVVVNLIRQGGGTITRQNAGIAKVVAVSNGLLNTPVGNHAPYEQAGDPKAA
jgi:hypothetical protein